MAEKNIISMGIKENRRGPIRQLFNKIRQYNVTAKEIKGRRIKVSDDHWVIDFASCNYLGLDLDPEMDYTISREISKWGVHPSWSRIVASPDIYNQLEDKLAKLVGTESCIILPTVTLISIGILPVLVGKSGVLILDKSGHETMYEAAKIARDNGAVLESFEHENLQSLEAILNKHKDNPRKVILVDGVYSMTGDYVMLPEIVDLARKFDAIVYIDDAHGFGVVGEKPSKKYPLGKKGNGIVKHFGLDYKNIIYVGGCSKAYSSLAAFVGCSKEMETYIEAISTPYDESGPCPTASLATLLQGLKINEERGDEYRKRLWELTNNAINGLRDMGYKVMNKTGFPIVSVHVGDTDKLITTANMLFDEGVMVTVAPFPMMKKGEEVHRITITASNTDEEIGQLLQAFRKVKKYII